MMFNNPYFSYPFHPTSNKNYPNHPFSNMPSNVYQRPSSQESHTHSQPKNSNSNDFLQNGNISKENKNYWDIFGIPLYFDDILLMLLIYCLYTDGVKDIYLFFILILLLLT